MYGELIHSRVVDDPGVPLETALDCELTGYAVYEPGGTLLLDDEDRGVLAFDRGVPVAARYPPDAGPDAVAALAGAGPYRVSLYAGTVDNPPGAPVAPEVPAAVLADDPALADRTRGAAPVDGPAPDESPDALEAFLDNEEKIEAIQARAREEAARRAEQWGLPTD